MKVTESSLQSESMTLAWQHNSKQTLARLNMGATEHSSAQQAPVTHANISAAGITAQQNDALSATANNELDPRIQLLLAIIEALTGRKLQLFNLADIQASSTVQSLPRISGTDVSRPSSLPWSVRIESSNVHEEAQTARYRASGQVATADGRNIKFSLDLLMQRYERTESSTTIDVSNAPKKTDPLVLNLTSDHVQLEAAQFSFDLNNDGKTENLARLATGSAFLALDKNGNGKIDNGSELFGPGSGDGFQDLSALDQDKNGWIDENDAAFNKLLLWRPDEQVQSLKAANVGAISLNKVSTPFTLKANSVEAGALRTTGLFLSENGQAKTLQQVDLVAR